MSDPYNNLDEQLRDAVERRAPEPVAAPKRGRGRFTWPRGGAIPILLGALVLGGGVATGAVVLKPASTASAQEQVRQAMDAGLRAQAELPACHRVRGTPPRLVSDPVPSWLSSRLGILRRPANAADRAAAAHLGGAIGSVVLRDSVRVAVQPDGWTYRFLLARGIGTILGGVQADPVACVRGVRDAALTAAATFPAAVQEQVRDAEDAEVAAIERQASGRTLQYQIDEHRPDGRPVSGGGGSLTDGGRLPATSGLGTYRHGNTRGHSVYSLLPDGVSTVRILDTAGTPRARPVTVKVVDNFFHTLLPRRFGPKMLVQWRSPSGTVLRTTHLRY